jgi:hypothetical protein
LEGVAATTDLIVSNEVPGSGRSVTRECARFNQWAEPEKPLAILDGFEETTQLAIGFVRRNSSSLSSYE